MEKQDKSRSRRDEQRRNYSKMDKGANNKLGRSPGENGGGQDAQKDLHSRTGRDEMQGKTQERWKEEVERYLQVLGGRSWTEVVIDRKKWNDIVRQAKARSGLQCQWKKKKRNEKYSINSVIYLEQPLISTVKQELKINFILVYG